VGKITICSMYRGVIRYRREKKEKRERFKSRKRERRRKKDPLSRTCEEKKQQLPSFQKTAAPEEKLRKNGNRRASRPTGTVTRSAVRRKDLRTGKQAIVVKSFTDTSTGNHYRPQTHTRRTGQKTGKGIAMASTTSRA